MTLEIPLFQNEHDHFKEVNFFEIEILSIQTWLTFRRTINTLKGLFCTLALFHKISLCYWATNA